MTYFRRFFIVCVSLSELQSFLGLAQTLTKELRNLKNRKQLKTHILWEKL
jgi:hypothetical protein